MTPEEYYAREERYYEEQRRIDERFGLIASEYINCKLKPGVDRVKPGDFFGYIQDTGPDHEMTPEESVAHLKAIFERRT